MARTNTSIQIDRLWQGTAGTAPFQRRAGQVTRARNIRFDLAMGGAVKRNGCTLIADLEPNSNNAPFNPEQEFHWCSIRGAVVAFGNGTINGWDEEGVPLAIIDTTGGAFATYTTTTTPIRKLTTATSFDTIIVCNRSKQVELLDSWSYQQSLRFIVNGDITNNTGVPTVSTNLAGLTVDDFSRLPPQSLPQSTYEATQPTWLTDPANGDIFRTRFDYEFDAAGIYIFWSGPVSAAARGYFEEHSNWFRVPVTRQANARYDETTMPYRVTYSESDRTLTLSACPWKQRVSGNGATNRRMPFSGSVLIDVAFHHGRLFLISKKHVCASRHDDYFNLWVDNVNAVADDDRIALDITESQIGNALFAAPCGKSLLIACENGPIEFHSADQPLTNSNGQQKRIANMQVANVDPAAVANTIVLLDGFGDLHRFNYTNSEVGIVYTEMLTVHKRKLLWGKTVQTLCIVADTLFVCCLEDDMLVHDSFNVQGELVQSAWGDFTTVDYPVFVDAWGGEIRILTRDPNTSMMASMLSYIHREQEPESPMLYAPRLDRLEVVAPGGMTFDSATNTTAIAHTGKNADMDRTVLVRTDDGYVHTFIEPKSVNNMGEAVFAGNLTADAQYLGFRFDTEFVLTRLYPGLTSYGLTTQRLVTFFYESTDFLIQGTQRDDGRELFRYQFEHQSERVDIARVGNPVFDTHFRECEAIGGNADDIEITISSSSPGQFAIIGLEYQVNQTGPGRTG